jgi:hypothetical protein
MTSNWDAPAKETRSYALLDFASLSTALPPKNDAFKDGFEGKQTKEYPRSHPFGVQRVQALRVDCGPGNFKLFDIVLR